MRALIWTPPARADLRSINTYLLEQADPATAIRQLTAIRTRADLLLAFPHAGPLVSNADFRSLRVAGTPYTLVYRVRGSDIQLLRIHHHSQNWRPPA